MCGIAGFCNLPKGFEENISAMNQRMLHRGPDAGGYWVSISPAAPVGEWI